MFLPYFLYPPLPPSLMCACPGEEEALHSRSQALDFQSYFYKLKKWHRQPAYSENSKSKDTGRSSLGVGDPGRLDIQPAAGRKEGVKQQLPKAEMMGLDLHKGQVARHPISFHCCNIVLSPCSGLWKLFLGLSSRKKKMFKPTWENISNPTSLWNCFSPSLYCVLLQLIGIGILILSFNLTQSILART